MNSKLEILKAALRAVKKRKADEPNKGICYVLSYCVQHSDQTAMLELKMLINKRLGDRAYLGGWLFKNRHITEAQLGALYNTSHPDCKALRAKLKATRIAWLEALIKEHSK